MKYRICKNKNDMYKVQKKIKVRDFDSSFGIMFLTFFGFKVYKDKWVSENCSYNPFNILLYNTREEAENRILELIKKDEYDKNHDLWECEGEY